MPMTPEKQPNKIMIGVAVLAMIGISGYILFSGNKIKKKRKKVSQSTPIIDAMKKLKYKIFSDGNWNIVGVRSLAKNNAFDDEIFLIRRVNGKWEQYIFPITTDPGLTYLKNPMNTSGTAILAPGQYKDSHAWGFHRKQYEALVQVGPMSVYRDANRDDKLDIVESSRVTGTYGINIHKAGTNSQMVNNASAGCQVFARSADFNEAMSLLKQSGQKKFTYTLLTSDQVRPFLKDKNQKLIS